MKAPDKIYLTPLLIEGCGKNLSKRVTENDTVYIRKDLLLEWANEEPSHAIANIDAYPYEDAFRGHREKIEELIEKLNSL